jgi:hypothetical protein
MINIARLSKLRWKLSSALKSGEPWRDVLLMKLRLNMPINELPSQFKNAPPRAGFFIC